MRHSSILNESGLKWGDTRGNNSSPRPNCTSPFITPVLLAIKCCCQVWLQGVPKGTPKLVHSYCKTVLVLKNGIWDADEDLCTTMLNIRSPNFRGLHLHYPHEESSWAANRENPFDVLTKESLNKKQAGHPQPWANASSGLLWDSEAKIEPYAISPLFHYQRLQDTVNLFNNYYKLAEL